MFFFQKKIMAPFACTMGMTSSDDGSPSDWLITFECRSSDIHERIEGRMYGSPQSLVKTVDAQAAPVLMSVPIMNSKKWLSLMCTSTRVVELNHGKDVRCRLSVATVSTCD